MFIKFLSFISLCLISSSILLSKEIKLVVTEATSTGHYYHRKDFTDGFGGVSWYELYMPYQMCFSDESATDLYLVWSEETNFWDTKPLPPNLENIINTFYIQSGDELIISDKVKDIFFWIPTFEAKLFRNGIFIDHLHIRQFSWLKYPWEVK